MHDSKEYLENETSNKRKNQEQIKFWVSKEKKQYIDSIKKN